MNSRILVRGWELVDTSSCMMQRDPNAWRLLLLLACLRLLHYRNLAKIVETTGPGRYSFYMKLVSRFFYRRYLRICETSRQVVP